MKKTKVIILTSSILALVVAVSALYAANKTCTWKRQKIKWEMPVTWQVVQDSDSRFIAKGNDVTLEIVPCTEPGTAEAVAQKGFDSYDIIEKKQILQRRPLEAGDSGLARYLILGKGMINGKAACFWIAGMVNASAGIQLSACMWWYDNTSTATVNNKTTYAVARSFKALP